MILTPEQLQWINSRPAAVRDVALRLPPTQWYRLRQTGQRCWIQSYSEPVGGGPVTLRVYAERADFPDGLREAMAHGVFGIDPDDLEPWLDDPIAELRAKGLV